MKYLRYILALALVSGCVGHPADDEEDGPVGPVTPPTEEVSAGLVMDFTATWCVNCPRMTNAIEELMNETKGNIYPVCIHFRDDFSTNETEAIAADFNVQSYPSVVVNLDKSSLVTTTSKSLILAKLKEATKANKAPCVIEASAQDGKLSVEVTATDAGTYALGALLLENGVTAAQTGSTEDYVHNDILRKVLSASLAGEDLGTLKSGESIEKEFSFEITPGKDYHILTYVTDGGLVNAVEKITLL